MTSASIDTAPESDPAKRYVDAVVHEAAKDLGRELPLGTIVVGATDREDSTTAVAYPLGDRTIVWCSPAIATRLAALDQPHAMTVDEFIAAAEELGATFFASGRARVMTTAPNDVRSDALHADYDLVELDRDVAADRELLATFVAECSADDLDEAELDMDELDPAILVALAPDGSIASYASGRHWWLDADFDDIAVLTHPDHRGRRLGAFTVAEYVRRRQAGGRLMFYNCDVANLGSNRVAEAVGFELMVTVAAVRFG